MTEELAEDKHMDDEDLELLMGSFGRSDTKNNGSASTQSSRSETETIERERKKPEKEPEPQPQERCPYCSKKFVSVAHHLPHCDKNPEKIEKEKQTKKQKAKAKTREEPVKPGVLTTTRRGLSIEEEIIERPNITPLIQESIKTVQMLIESIKDLRENPIKVQLVKSDST